MFLSIVLPIYNAEKYLSDCVDSIISQDFDDYEIILADDGSTDNSPCICDEYAMKYNYIKVLHSANRGSYQIRIEGAKLATGDYIWFVDSDDSIMPGALERIKDSICDDENIEILIFNYCINKNMSKIQNGGVNSGTYEGERLYEIYKKFCSTDKINSVWRKCFKNSLINGNDKLEDIDHYCFGEDVYITAAALQRATRIKIIDDVLYSYRIENSGMTRNYNPKKIFDEEITLKRLEEFADSLQIVGGKGELVSGVRQRVTSICYGELWLLASSDMTKLDKHKELISLAGNPFFMEGLLNKDYQPALWWEKIIYKDLSKDKSIRYIISKLGICKRIIRFVKG
jgi:glycosyltransferase involved in cell wall biosynthesis